MSLKDNIYIIPLMCDASEDVKTLKKILKNRKLNKGITEEELADIAEACVILAYLGADAKTNDYKAAFELSGDVAAKVNRKMGALVDIIPMACFSNEMFFLKYGSHLRKWEKSRGLFVLSNLEGYSNKTDIIFSFFSGDLEELSNANRTQIVDVIGEGKFVDAVEIKTYAARMFEMLTESFNRFTKNSKETEEESSGFKSRHNDEDDDYPFAGLGNDAESVIRHVFENYGKRPEKSKEKKDKDWYKKLTPTQTKEILGDDYDRIPEGLDKAKIIDYRDFLSNNSPESLATQLKEYIAGQDEAVMAFSKICYEHVARLAHPEVIIKKSNCVMFGPTGCGKTEMIRVMERILPCPLDIIDANTITSEGFKGMDKEDVLSVLLDKRGLDFCDSIIVLDEFDKLCHPRHTSTGDDVNKEIQGQLLKMVEGDTMFLKYSGVEVSVPTHQITFICAGSFDGAFTKDIQKGLGFGSVDVDNNKNKSLIDCLISFGMIPELAGRISTMIPLKKLTEEDLYQILTDTKNNCIESTKNLYRFAYNLDIQFSDEALREICGVALRLKLGARGLQGIVDTVCAFIYSDMSSSIEENEEGIKSIVITDKIVRDVYSDINDSRDLYMR